MLVYCVDDSRSVSEPDRPSSCEACGELSVTERIWRGGGRRREEEAGGAGERVFGVFERAGEGDPSLESLSKAFCGVRGA